MSDSKEMKEITPEQTLNRWNGFIDGGVDLADVDHNSDVSHSNYTTGRVRGGVDYRIARNFRVGAFFGYSHTDADLDEEGSKAHINSYSPGIFATYADKRGFYANGIFTYTRNDYSTDRDIIFPGVDRTATGAPSGNQYGGDLDGGYEFHQGNWTFGPSAGLTYVNLGINSFSESGAGAADLSINSQSAESLRSRLGGTVRYDAKICSFTVTPHLSAFWQHEFLDGGNFITSQFEGLPAGSFSVETTPGDSDDALLDFGIDAEITNSLTLFVDYESEAGGDTYFGQAATAGVRLDF
jgi:outer membrane autotransporter protein